MREPILSKDGKTRIISNGYIPPGESEKTFQENIDWLKGRIKNFSLDARFYDVGYYGEFDEADKSDMKYRLFGNFESVSHVFDIETNDEKLYQEFKTLIDANMSTEHFKKSLKHFISNENYWRNNYGKAKQETSAVQGTLV